jgi:hypothetical protein
VKKTVPRDEGQVQLSSFIVDLASKSQLYASIEERKIH